MSRPWLQTQCLASHISIRTTRGSMLLKPCPSSQCLPQHHPLIGPLIMGVALRHCKTISSQPLTPHCSPLTSLTSLKHTLPTHHPLIITPPLLQHSPSLPKCRHLFPRTRRWFLQAHNGQIQMYLSSMNHTSRFRATSVKAQAHKIPGLTSRHRIQSTTKWALA